MLGRYVISSKEKYLYIEDGVEKAKFHLFLPGNDGSLSMYEISNFSKEELWKVADDFVTGMMTVPQTVNACAIIQIQKIESNKKLREAGLQFVRDGDPHPNHINIEKWPDKATSKLLAMEFSLLSEVTRR